MTTGTRSSLLDRVRDPADDRSWREFFALYEPLLQAYVRRRGVSGHDVEDAVQDILSRLVKTLPGFHLQRSRGRFRTWLWRVTMNTLSDRGRLGHRRLVAEHAWAVARPDDSPPIVEDADWTTMHRSRLLEYAEAKVRERSHPRTWACFEEHLRKGRPSAEVAPELGVSANVVDINSSRILARLRTFCRNQLEDLIDVDDPMSP